MLDVIDELRRRDADHSYPALRALAEQHGLRHLSMGTSQDYLVAVQEGATIVRLGSVLYGGRRADSATESS